MPTPHPGRTRSRRASVHLAAALLAALCGSASLSARPSLEAAPDDVEARRVQMSKRLAQMLEAVEVHHVGEPRESGALVEGAIRGMLDTLDPHTHFLDAESYRMMREGQDGSFHGLGIIISMRRDNEGKNRLTVISPIDGMPAKRLGIRPGDIIAAIDGESTDDLTLDGAVAKLRGEKGTTVKITIEREKETLDLVVERAEIPTESIQHAYMIRPDTGFIRVKDFTKSTTRELRESIASLRRQGMSKLILDLRDNPGGLLDESVSVSSTFLEPGQLVVETRGRIEGSNEKRFSSVDGERLDAGVPLIVLVNNGSASASEIVAGAIQDHDRGLIVGTTTWGKGLVQSVYSLSADAGLALTTARYYTPAGRQIQRDYRSSYYEYLYGPRKGLPLGPSHSTDAGRAVYSGGGIQPDVEVEEQEIDSLVGRFIARSTFFRFANKVHLARDAGKVEPGYSLTDQDVADFRAFVDAEGLSPLPAEWDAALDQVKVQLRTEILNAHLGLQEGFKVQAEADRQVQAALGLWEKAQRAALERPVNPKIGSARSNETGVVR
jgi:carboxyl-terminal processing protease